MSAGDRISTRIVPVAALSAAQWQQIWELTREFVDVERAYAEAELRKRHKIALFVMNDVLLGMASIDVYTTKFRGRKLVIIYTTHVLLRENWRGRNLIQKLGLHTFVRARLRHPWRPIYWFFDTSSYKSYLLMPRNFRTWWPRRDLTTPEYEAALMDHLAAAMYGPAWRPARGLAVRSGQRRLQERTAPIDLGAELDPDLEYFAHINPGFAEGDMLVCLAPLTFDNWRHLVRRARARRERRAH